MKTRDKKSKILQEGAPISHFVAFYIANIRKFHLTS